MAQVLPRGIARALLVLGIWVVVAVSAQAGSVLVGQDSSTGYGMLNQRAISGACDDGEMACGPTATVNSFIYLQNRYPLVYGTRLVPDMAHPEDTVTQLAPMMGCVCGSGTTLSGLLAGKTAYIQGGNDALGVPQTGVAPGTTTFESQEDPGSIAWLVEQLAKGQDVEMLYGHYTKDGATFTRNGGHWVTVTGVTYNDNNNNNNFDGGDTPANVSFIDPYGNDNTTLNGAIFRQNVAMAAGLVNAGGFGNLLNLSGLGGGDDYKLIDGWVAESPIPEPATLVLLVLGLAALSTLRRRWYSPMA
ncbi:MAG: PEP-CTERM sorting domain-containing protein [Acetobacteraceae bacterium]